MCIILGRQFDKNGNMIEWWDSNTIYTFREKAQCMVDQYSKYKMQEVNLHVNGRMTQGENIADNGGLKQSFRVPICFCILKVLKYLVNELTHLIYVQHKL